MKAGDLVTWTHTTSKGYGYTTPVTGCVVRIGPKKVQIEVKNRHGSSVLRWVEPKNLRPWVQVQAVEPSHARKESPRG